MRLRGERDGVEPIYRVDVLDAGVIVSGQAEGCG